MSKVKQNFHSDSEALINKQINMELYASYVYLSMSAYFARDDIALPGFSKRFKEASTEERDHAMKLIDYQTMRGGRVVFREIAKPTLDDWGTALEAVEATLELERTCLTVCIKLHNHLQVFIIPVLSPYCIHHPLHPRHTQPSLLP